jgi:hypothetical protein
VGWLDGCEVGWLVGKQSPIAPNCTSNPLGLLEAPPLLTVKVIVVIFPRPFKVNEDNPPKLLPPLKEVIVLDDDPDTTTEVRVSSTEK